VIDEENPYSLIGTRWKRKEWNSNIPWNTVVIKDTTQSGKIVDLVNDEGEIEIHLGCMEHDLFFSLYEMVKE